MRHCKDSMAASLRWVVSNLRKKTLKKPHRLPSRRAVRHWRASVLISSSSMLIMLAMLAARFIVDGLQHIHKDQLWK